MHRLNCFKIGARSVNDILYIKLFELQLENYFWFFWRIVENSRVTFFRFSGFLWLKYKTGLPYFGYLVVNRG